MEKNENWNELKNFVHVCLHQYLTEKYLQARIKKIMQADEDVGKIAMAVPVLVCELLAF